MRIATFAFLAACSSGSSDLLKDGPTVGTPCGGATTFTDALGGDATKYTAAHVDLDGDDTEILLVPAGGQLTLTTCKFEWSGGGPETVRTVTVEAQELGTFTVAAGVSLFPGIDDPATAGSVTLTGYNAEVGQLCGSVDLTTKSGARLRGTFSGDVFCD